MKSCFISDFKSNGLIKKKSLEAHNSELNAVNTFIIPFQTVFYIHKS